MQEEKILQNQNNHTEPDVEPTNRDILEAVNGFATHVEGRFTQIEGRFTQIDERFTRVEHRLDRIENTMVTKSYLDDKLGDLRGDLPRSEISMCPA